MESPKVIALTYELRSGSAQGDVIEIADKDQPAEFLFGVGNLIKEFEDQVQTLQVGEKFEFTIIAENAYGGSNPEAIVDLPKDIFMVDGVVADELLQIGSMVPMRDNQGNPLNGKILEVAETTVKMDFNHPLAGHDLHFKGEILSTRAASPEEVDHGHVHTGKDGH